MEKVAWSSDLRHSIKLAKRNSIHKDGITSIHRSIQGSCALSLEEINNIDTIFKEQANDNVKQDVTVMGYWA